jgi:hypothetical protein
VENYSGNLWETSGKFLIHGSLGRYTHSQVFPKHLSTLCRVGIDPRYFNDQSGNSLRKF